jgi:hypothetical protein
VCACRRKKRSGADKSEARRQFASLQDRAASLCKCFEGSRKKAMLERPKQTAIFAVLREYNALPSIDFNPGGAWPGLLCSTVG